MHSAPLYSFCVASHIVVLSLLSVRRWQLSQLPAGTRPLPSGIIKLLGTVVAVATLTLPYTGPDEPFLQCGIRVACFFYAFKLFDLALTKASDPPKLLSAASKGQSTLLELLRYVWLLLTEMRYRAFDIETVQKGRPSARITHRELASKLLPPVAVVGIACAFPIAETKCLIILCLIQNALEGLHTLLHPWCPYSLFYRPFSAATLGNFWTIHWHASAVFLQSIAYKPVRKRFGRGYGVIAAFALSGVWHGWASMPLVDDEHAARLGLQVCIFFVMLGVGTLIERVVWPNNPGGWPQRVLAWSWALAWAGWCFRTVECHAKIGILRTGKCGS